MANDRTEQQNNNDNNEQKSFVANRLKKQRKYFDSADWMMSGKKESSLPVKTTPTSPRNPEIDEENKENMDTEDKATLSQNLLHKLSEKPERKYFDSADWMMSGKETPLPGQTYRNFPQPELATVVTKKRIEKSRKYFDSADWAMSLNGRALPTSVTHPKKIKSLDCT